MSNDFFFLFLTIFAIIIKNVIMIFYDAFILVIYIVINYYTSDFCLFSAFVSFYSESAHTVEYS